MSNGEYHTTVLLHEAIEALNINPNGTYVDVTYGGGGHSIEILKKLDKGRLLAFDQDEGARKNIIEDDRLTFIGENFRHMANFIAFHGAKKVDGILADLGVSGHQFDEAERGFSLRADAELDMRMNRNQAMSAKQMLAEMDEQAVMTMLNENADLRRVPAIARAIVRASQEKRLNTTNDLKDSVCQFAPRNKEHKFYAQVFQAIRIAVNDELGALKDFLKQSVEVLAPGGRLVIISYHSLEDRLVKNFLRSGSLDGTQTKDFYGNLIRPLDPVSSKAMTPTEEEIIRNNRARSAKMRVGIRNDQPV